MYYVLNVDVNYSLRMACMMPSKCWNEKGWAFKSREGVTWCISRVSGDLKETADNFPKARRVSFWVSDFSITHMLSGI